MPTEPLTLVAALAIAVGALWRIHLKEDEKREAKNEKKDAQLDMALAGWKEQTEANTKQAKSSEEITDIAKELLQLAKGKT